VQPAVFLDRDNTLIHNDGDLGDPDQVRLVEDVPPSLKALREAGYSLVVVTNQGGVARNKFSEQDVDAVHQRIAQLVDDHAHGNGLIDRFYYCPYHPEATVAEYRRDHPWRKPHPGMILQAARDMGLELSASWMVGDQERDILAGRAAGCRTILVTKDADLAKKCQPTTVCESFSSAVREIFRQAPPAELRREMSAARTNAAPSAHTGWDAPAASADRASVPDVAGLRRAIGELTEEIRSDRVRRSEFTMLRMIGVVLQLGAVFLAVLGLMQLGSQDVFMKWMIGAAITQLAALTVLVMDLKA